MVFSTGIVVVDEKEFIDSFKGATKALDDAEKAAPASS